MANLPVKNGEGSLVYIKKTGAGTDLDPFTEPSDPELSSIDDRVEALLQATTLNTPTTEILTNFDIAQNGNTSNFVNLKGRAFLLYLPAGLEGTLLYVQVRFTTGVTARLKDMNGGFISVYYDSSAAVVAVPFLTDAIGSEIAFETSVNQTAARILRLKVLR